MADIQKEPSRGLVGIIINPLKPGLFLRFVKEYTILKPAVARWWPLLKKGRRTTYTCNKIYIQQQQQQQYTGVLHQME